MLFAKMLTTCMEAISLFPDLDTLSAQQGAERQNKIPGNGEKLLNTETEST